MERLCAAILAWLGRQSEAAMARFRAPNPAHKIGSWKAMNDYGGSPGGAPIARAPTGR